MHGAHPSSGVGVASGAGRRHEMNRIVVGGFRRLFEGVEMRPRERLLSRRSKNRRRLAAPLLRLSGDGREWSETRR